jgi:dihydrofolate synthase/folylpolyglutamate synthase
LSENETPAANNNDAESKDWKNITGRGDDEEPMNLPAPLDAFREAGDAVFAALLTRVGDPPGPGISR